jgi:hypothetical protein
MEASTVWAYSRLTMDEQREVARAISSGVRPSEARLGRPFMAMIPIPASLAFFAASRNSGFRESAKLNRTTS